MAIAAPPEEASLAAALAAGVGKAPNWAPIPPLARDGSNRLHRAARQLAAAGIPVMPCDDHKTPATVGGVAAATIDNRTVDRWFLRPSTQADLVWACPPDAVPAIRASYGYGPPSRLTLAIATGGISGLVVVDVDPFHGADASLAQLAADGCEWPATITVATPHGRHLYFRAPGQPVPSQQHLLPGVSICADPSSHPSHARHGARGSGWVIVPPSRAALQYGGASYRVQQAGPLADLPSWLLALLAEVS